MVLVRVYGNKTELIVDRDNELKSFQVDQGQTVSAIPERFFFFFFFFTFRVLPSLSRVGPPRQRLCASPLLLLPERYLLRVHSRGSSGDAGCPRSGDTQVGAEARSSHLALRGRSLSFPAHGLHPAGVFALRLIAREMARIHAIHAHNGCIPKPDLWLRMRKYFSLVATEFTEQASNSR